MAKKIRLKDGADPAAVIAVVGRTSDELGFALVPSGPTTAVAHDGGKEVTGNATATKARLDLRLSDGRVEIRKETTGAAYAGAAGVGFFAARINSRYAKFAKQLKRDLAAAGLA